jgi:leucyl-tRNA synthetase
VKCDEPFTNLLTQGMVVAETYYREESDGHRIWFNPAAVEVDRDAKGKITAARSTQDGKPVQLGNIEKMSKSKNNGVDPQTLIDYYGADTVRLFAMFASPPEQSLEWSDAGVEGAFRFLKRLWTFAYDHRANFNLKTLTKKAVKLDDAPEDIKKARHQLHSILRQANYDFSKYQFNTVVSAGMKILNLLESFVPPQRVSTTPTSGNGPINYESALMLEGFKDILLPLLAPITPHICDYLWRELGFGDDILDAPWPEPDEAALQQDEIELVLQVNGKVRGSMRVASDASREAIEAAALASDTAGKYLAGKPPKKVVVVPGRLVNIVAG